MGAEIGVDVLGRELAAALAIDGPVGEVADDALVLVDQLPAGQSVRSWRCQLLLAKDF